MTLLAFHAGVLAIERISGLTMVKLFDRKIPMNEMEIGAVVLEMAADTVFSLRVLHLQVRVVAMFFREGLGDFLVAVEALECGTFCAKDVATVALASSAETVVGLRKRARRNLRVGGNCAEQEEKGRKQESSGKRY